MPSRSDTSDRQTSYSRHDETVRIGEECGRKGVLIGMIVAIGRDVIAVWLCRVETGTVASGPFLTIRSIRSSGLLRGEVPLHLQLILLATHENSDQLACAVHGHRIGLRIDRVRAGNGQSVFDTQDRLVVEFERR